MRSQIVVWINTQISRITRPQIWALIIAYCLSLLLQFFYPIYSQRWRQEGQINQTSLVAVIVEETLYDRIRGQIDRYASHYIQYRLPHTRAIILPMASSVMAREVLGVIENLWTENTQNWSSRLDGIVLIGDIPLPVVNDDWYIFPTIYPYTDLLKPAYIWDKNHQFFEKNEITDRIPELWHGRIWFGTDEEYVRYFRKLRTYQENPNQRTDHRLWYDNFIQLKETFSADSFLGYLNTLFLAEDVAYHRFSNLMITMLMGSVQSQVDQMFAQAGDNASRNDQRVTAEWWLFGEVDGWEQGQLWAFWRFLQRILGERDRAQTEAAQIIAQTDGADPSKATAGNQQTKSPTLFLPKAVQELTKAYNAVVGEWYQTAPLADVRAMGYWTGFDSHRQKTIHQDSLVTKSALQNNPPLLTMYNTILENSVLSYVNDQKFAMKIPVNQSYRTIRHQNMNEKIGICPLCIPRNRCEKTEDDLYETHFFGTTTDTLTGSESMSIYRGQFVNKTGRDDAKPFAYATHQKNLAWPSLATDPAQWSIGRSLSIFSTQTQSQRWFNYDLAPKDAQQRDEERQFTATRIFCNDYFSILGIKIFCKKRGREFVEETQKKRRRNQPADNQDGDNKETPDEFAQRIRWWFSLINLKSWTMQMQNLIPQNALSPLRDSKGTRAVEAIKTGTDSFLAQQYFLWAIQRTDRFWELTYNKTLIFDDIKKLGRDTKGEDIARDYEEQYLKPNVSILSPYLEDYLTPGQPYYTREGNKIFFPFSIKNFLPRGSVDFFSIFDGQIYHNDGWDKRHVPFRPTERRNIFVNDQIVQRKWGSPAVGKCLLEWIRRQHETIYRYKLIDSRQYNLAPTPSLINQFALTTDDRPIDSIRNITFQGIGWDMIRLTMPNVYAIPVYKKQGNWLVLMTREEIEQSIRTTLINQVKAYNTIIAWQQAKAPTFFTQHTQAFTELGKIDPLAKPSLDGRPYQLFPETYLIDQLTRIVWSWDTANSDPIKTLAAILYHHNALRPTKMETATIEQELDALWSQNFLPHKIKTNLEYYLTENMTNPSNPDHIPARWLPWYRPDGYEAAFLVSDGLLRFPQVKEPPLVTRITRQLRLPRPDVPTMTAADREDEQPSCGSLDEAYDLFILRRRKPGEMDRFQAFRCWLEEIRTNPLKLEFSYQDAEWPVIPIFGNNLQSWFDEFSKQYVFDEKNKASEQRKRYGDQRRIMILSNRRDRYMADRRRLEEARQGQQVWSPRHSTQTEQINELTTNINRIEEELALLGVGKKNPATDPRLTRLEQSVTVSIQGPGGQWLIGKPFGFSDQAYIQIQSQWSQTGEFEIRIASSGDNCLIIDGNNSCTRHVSLGRFPLEAANVILANQLRLASNKAWLMGIFVDICIPNTDQCITTTKPMTIVPTEVARVEFRFPLPYVIAGVTTPFVIKAFDPYDNPVDQTLTNWTIRVNEGDIDGVKLREFGSFDELFFYAFDPTTPNEDKLLNFIVQDQNNTAKTFRFQIPLYYPTITATFSQTTYQLPESINAVMSGDSVVRQWWWPRVELTARSSRWLPLQVPLSIQAWPLLKVGTIIPKWSWSQLKPQTSFTLSGDQILYLWSEGMKKLDENLVISRPNQQSLTQRIVFEPASPYRLTFDRDTQATRINQSYQFSGTVRDRWDNLVTIPTAITIGTLGTAKISTTQQWDTTEADNHSAAVPDQWQTQQIQSVNGFFSAKTTITNLWPAYLYALVTNKGLDDQVPALVSLLWSADVIPRTGLNVMYLTLAGNDWANWHNQASPTYKATQTMLATSSKLLTITSQLTDPRTIHQAQIQIFDDGRYVGPEPRLSSTLSGIILSINNEQRSLPSLPLSQWEEKTVWRQWTLTPSDDRINSVIRNNQVIVNGTVVFDPQTNRIDPNLSFSFGIQERLTWFVSYQNTRIGEVSLIPWDAIIRWPQWQRTRWAWSSNVRWWRVLPDTTTRYQHNFQNWLEAIAENPTQGNAFRIGGQHLASWTAWSNVGDATKLAMTPFMINDGDPTTTKHTTTTRLLTQIDHDRLPAPSSSQSKPTTPSPHTQPWGTPTQTPPPTKPIPFDQTAWQMRRRNTESPLITTLIWDINNDDIADSLIIYRNGRVQWLKQYNNGRTDLGDLMFLADQIQKARLGDINNDGYADIIILTQSQDLRAYTNNRGIFDVDGFPICLDLPGHEISRRPHNMTNARQLEIRDMDLDGNLDIIALDNEGSITIWYGWERNGKPTYLSSQPTQCDPWRQEQLVQEKLPVTQFATVINPEQKVVDESLIRRIGLSEEEWFAEETTIDPSLVSPAFEDNTQSLNPFLTIPRRRRELRDFLRRNNPESIDPSTMIPDLTQFPTDELINQSMNTTKRFVPDPSTDIYPMGETLAFTDIRYREIGFGSIEDPVLVHKTYSDLNGWALARGDKVRITVTIQGKTTRRLTYINQDRGARAPDQWSGVQWRNTGNLNNDIRLIKLTNRDDEYSFVIENISLGDQPAIFSYTRTRWGDIPIASFAIQDRNRDTYPDIVVYPKDGCLGYINDYLNIDQSLHGKARRWYQKIQRAVADPKNQAMTDLQNNLNSFLTKTSETIQSIAQSGSMETIPWRDRVKEQFSLQTLFDNNFSIIQWFDTTSIVDSVLAPLWVDTQDIERQIQSVLDGMCQWFRLGSKQAACKWPPIPFNMSFLSPGRYQIFGCALPTIIPWVIGNDNGFPILAFPATLPTPAWPMPAPFPWWGILKMPGIDQYGYFGFAAPSGTYPSMIRVYLSPTLTMGLGIAFCFWPQRPMSMIPSPLRDIAGNCIVFAIPFSNTCNQWGWEDWLLDEIALDTNTIDASKVQCTNQPRRPNRVPFLWARTDVSSSPTVLIEDKEKTLVRLFGTDYSFNDLTQWNVANDTVWFQQAPLGDGGVYGPFGIGLVEFERKPLARAQMSDPLATTQDVLLRPWIDVKTRIEGWMMKAKGLFACVLNNWLDRQSRYIINNLTNMTIGVYLPDITTLFQWFDQLTLEKLREYQKVANNTQTFDLRREISQEWWFVETIDSNARRFLPQKANFDHLASSISNPFEAIQSLFSAVPLIDIATRDIVLQVPMLTADEVTRYSSYLEAWYSRNLDILNQWNGKLGEVFGFCGYAFPALERAQFPTGINPSASQNKESYKKLKQRAAISAQVSAHATEGQIILLNAKTRIQLTEQGWRANAGRVDNLIRQAQRQATKIIRQYQKDEELLTAMTGQLTTLTTRLGELDLLVQRFAWNEEEITTQLRQISAQMAILDQTIKTKTAKRRIIENQQRITSNPSQAQQARRSQQITTLTNEITNAQADYDQLAQQRQSLRQELDLDTMLTQLDEGIALFAWLMENGTMPPQCLDLVFGWWFGKELLAMLKAALELGIIGWFAAVFNLPTMEGLDGILEMLSNAELAVTRVRENILVLQQYKKFPLELAKWLNITDRYLSEVAGIIQTFLGTIAQWMMKNSRRFSLWVDAIVILILTIKTRQVIIDVSVNRQKQCSTCSNDNYTFYGCGFGFICNFINLPILPIPPLRIPSIYIDLSHIDAHIMVMLPTFRLAPVMLSLPQLPDLPRLPPVLASIDINGIKDLILLAIEQFLQAIGFNLWAQFAQALEQLINEALRRGGVIDENGELALDFGSLGWVIAQWLEFLRDIDLTNIPVIPAPPVLPPLPSFIPSVTLKLPDLPPAPKIPRLIPQIDLILDILDLVGKIYCIIKGWWIWLVAEKWVKSKIEQMTQRTWPVPFFDYMDLTRISFFQGDVLRGFDYRIDAYTQFKFNFSYIYDVISFFADYVNEFTNEQIMKPTNQAIDSFSQTLNQQAQQITEPLNRNLEINIVPERIMKQLDQQQNENQREEPQQPTNQPSTNQPSTSTPQPNAPQWYRDHRWLSPSHRDALASTLYGDRRVAQEMEIPEAKSFLERGLRTLLNHEQVRWTIRDTVNNLLALATKDRKAQGNHQWLETMQTIMDDIMTQHQKIVTDLRDRVETDYDGLIQELRTSWSLVLVADTPHHDTQLAMPLRTVDAQFHTLTQAMRHPTREIVDLHRTVLNVMQEPLQAMKNTPSFDPRLANEINQDVAFVSWSIQTIKNIFDWQASESDRAFLDQSDEPRKSRPWDQPALCRVEDEEWNWLRKEEEKHQTQSSIPPIGSGGYTHPLPSISLPWPRGEGSGVRSNTSTEPNIQTQVFNQTNVQSSIPPIYGGGHTSPRLLAQASNPQSLPTNAVSSLLSNPLVTNYMDNVDLATYVQGIWYRDRDQATNVVSSIDQINAIGERYDFVHLDEPVSQGIDYARQDLLMHDDSRVWHKHALNTQTKQPFEKANDRDFARGERFVVDETAWSQGNATRYRRQRTQRNDGHIRVWWDNLRIASRHYMVKNFRTIGQRFDQITVWFTASTKQNDNVAGYLIRTTRRADIFDTKQQVYSFFDRQRRDQTTPIQYVLMLPLETQRDNGRVIVPDELDVRIPDAMTGTIIKVEYYDPESPDLAASLTNMERTRYYMQIASLINEGTDDRPIYTKASNWSNQIVAGQQLIADNEPPVPTVVLHRVRTNTDVMEWLSLEWTINTHYQIRIKREDKAGILENRVIATGNQRLRSGNMQGDTFVIDSPRIFWDEEIRRDFQIGALDTQGNVWIASIRLDLSIPSIDIEDVTATGMQSRIVSRISTDMDEGSIQYQRKRRNVWEVMQGSDALPATPSLFPLTTNQVINTGQWFSLSDAIEFFDAQENVLARMDSTNGKIDLTSSGVFLDLDLSRRIPVLVMRNQTTRQAMFDIYLQPKAIVGTPRAGNPRVTITPIQEPKLKAFNNGRCIQINSQRCDFFVAPTWLIYASDNANMLFGGRYRFDPTTNAVIYTITNRAWQEQFAVSFAIEGILQ